MDGDGPITPVLESGNHDVGRIQSFGQVGEHALRRFGRDREARDHAHPGVRHWWQVPLKSQPIAALGRGATLVDRYEYQFFQWLDVTSAHRQSTTSSAAFAPTCEQLVQATGDALGTPSRLAF